MANEASGRRVLADRVERRTLVSCVICSALGRLNYPDPSYDRPLVLNGKADCSAHRGSGYVLNPLGRFKFL